VVLLFVARALFGLHGFRWFVLNVLSLKTCPKGEMVQFSAVANASAAFGFGLGPPLSSGVCWLTGAEGVRERVAVAACLMSMLQAAHLLQLYLAIPHTEAGLQVLEAEKARIDESDGIDHASIDNSDIISDQGAAGTAPATKNVESVDTNVQKSGTTTITSTSDSSKDQPLHRLDSLEPGDAVPMETKIFYVCSLGSSFLRAATVAGLEVATALVLEKEFGWSTNSIGFAIGVTFLAGAPVSLALMWA
jgi:hypothetical protein